MTAQDRLGEREIIMSDKIDDGGAAFPTEPIEEPGMTLRDWFAAHAPHKPTFAFPVVMDRLRPEPDGTRNDCQNWKEILAWDDEEGKQQMRQWPYAWADAMLNERERRNA